MFTTSARLNYKQPFGNSQQKTCPTSSEFGELMDIVDRFETYLCLDIFFTLLRGAQTLR